MNKELLPKRAHVIKIELGADTQDDLIYTLQQIVIDLKRGSLGHVVSGSPSAGYSFDYSVNEDMTHDRYFELLDVALK